MGALDVSLGLLEVGILISVFLFGIISVQAYAYYTKFPDDTTKLKLFVSSSILAPRPSNLNLLSYDLLRLLIPGTPRKQLHRCLSHSQIHRLNELVGTILISHTLYNKTITGFGNYEILPSIPLSLSVSTIITAFMVLPVQVDNCFYIYSS